MLSPNQVCGVSDMSQHLTDVQVSSVQMPTKEDVVLPCGCSVPEVVAVALRKLGKCSECGALMRSEQQMQEATVTTPLLNSPLPAPERVPSDAASSVVQSSQGGLSNEESGNLKGARLREHVIPSGSVMEVRTLLYRFH